MEIRNHMEILLDQILDGVLNEMDYCTCDKCKLDIKAITLNNVKPKYTVTEKGELYAKLQSLQSQFEVDMVSQITKAAVLVANNPRH